MLEVHNLSVSYKIKNKEVEALHDVSFTIAEKENYGLIGESGAGKSTVALSILRCLPQTTIEQGKIIFQNQDLTKMPLNQLRLLWGKEIAFVPQDALAALNPSLKIGDQIEEVLQHQHNLTHADAKKISLVWLDKVHLAHPTEIASKYPHQLSGGMLQRVMLAMALCTKPRFVILDEPTSQLDVTTQGVFLSLLKNLIDEENLTVLYISHNLKLIKKICTRVGVLFSGVLIEEGKTENLFNQPLHPYTQSLLSSMPAWGSHISALHITPPKTSFLPSSQGCRFFSYCSWAENNCKNFPLMEENKLEHKVRCFRWQDIQQITQTHEKSTKSFALAPNENNSIKSNVAPKIRPFIKIEKFSVSYPTSIWKLLPFRTRQANHAALHQVDLVAYRDRALGILGESGSGKTTLAKAVMGLIHENNCKNSSEALQLWLEDDYYKLPQHISKRSPNILRSLQMIFQNLDESLNPYLKVGEILERPLIRLLKYKPQTAQEKAISLLQAVHLGEDYINRYPSQLSGGEKQRVALARAIASQPTLLICDEAVSALDSTVQSFVLRLLYDLRQQHHLCLWIISHDLGVITLLADDLIIMLEGYIIERSTRESFLKPPHHPYTYQLIQAAKDVLLADDPHDHTNGNHRQNIGCFYAAHCPQRKALESSQVAPLPCYTEAPTWKNFSEGQKSIYCHYPQE